MKQIGRWLIVWAVLLQLVYGYYGKNDTYPQPPVDLVKLDKSYRFFDGFDISDTTFSYHDANGTKHSIDINGAYWYFRGMVAKKEQPKKIESLLSLLQSKGALLLEDNKEKSDIKLIWDRPQKHEKIYIDITYGWSDHFRVYIHQERYLPFNTPVDVVLDESNASIPSEMLLRAPFDGEHYVYLKVDVLSPKGVKIKTMSYPKGEGVFIRNEQSMQCDPKYYKHYTMFSLDPYRGMHDFKLTTLGKKAKVRLRLVETDHKVTPLGTLSEKPGVFQLKNSLNSLPTLKSIGYINGSYGKPKGDYLPNGDALYWLNNAYYSFSKDGLRTNLVPVRSEHKTTVTWPVYFSAMQDKQHIKDVKATTQMAIFGTHSDDNTTVRVDLSLSHLPKGLTLQKEDFAVYEDGSIPGKVLNIEHLHEPMQIVLLLDSSGSMKHSMRAALQSVRTFLEKLPEDAKITLVDFDTKVKVLQTGSKSEVLQKLSRIRANGATALYDAIIKGTKLLEGKSRASIILFTDGKDANYNDTRRGSKATFDQMIAKVQDADVPIYPIAFGKHADTTTLSAIARMTKTAYYQGENMAQIDRIFEDIRQTLSSAYRLTYQRGKTPIQGAQPVVNYMVDVSGSMDLRSSFYSDCKGCANRFEPLKSMLAQSIESLPKGTFVQLSTFASDVTTVQILTQDKAKLLSGIGVIKTGGGTEILKALKKGLALCKVQPSSRRYFIFTTDAAADAFKFDKEQQKELKAVLMAFKRSGIKSFWLGMWEDPKTVAHMQQMAKLSSGESFVSSDIEKIKQKILAVTRKVGKESHKAQNVSSVSIKLKKRDARTGVSVAAVGESPLNLPILHEQTPSRQVKEVAYTIRPFKTDAKSYNAKTAHTIYGDDMPIKDVRISKIIPLRDDQNHTIAAHNKAVKISVGKAYLLGRLKGLDAGHGSTYLVLDVNMTNMLPVQKVAVSKEGGSHPASWIGQSNENYTYKEAIPAYEIPNFANHLFIRLNGSHEMPMSPMTWALEKPLLPMDATSLTIDGNRSKSGMLLFRIPDKSVASLSLHFYDTAYGHIDLPIIGTMKQHAASVEVLPKQPPKKLGNAFSLSVLGRHFDDTLAGTKAPKGSLYETLIVAMNSKVDALLALDPQKRFRLKIDSPYGDWMLKPAPITQMIPLGLYDALSLAPGSHNRFALVFQVPTLLQDAPQSLVVSLRGKDKEVGISKENTPPKIPKVLAKADADGISLSLNGIYRLDRLDRYSGDYLLADVTLDEKEDGSAARLHHMLQLTQKAPDKDAKKKPQQHLGAVSHRGLGNFSSVDGGTNPDVRNIDSKTNTRVLGCNGMAPDGYQKRCLVLFDLHGLNKEKPLYLTSPVFAGLSYTVEQNKLKSLSDKAAPLLVNKQKLERSSWEKDMQAVLQKVRQQRIASGKGTAYAHKRVVSLEGAKDMMQRIAPLSASYAGSQKMQQAKSFKEAIAMLKKVVWVPAATDGALYSPEAMFTQGWGSEYAMTNYLYRMLKERNVKIEKGYYYLSKEGKKALAAKAGGVPVKYDKVPYLAWEEEGEKHSLVIPFLQDASMLRVMLKDKSSRNPLGSANAAIKMQLYYEKKNGTQTAQMGGMAAALGGGSGSKEKRKTLFSKSFRLDRLSYMPIDIFFVKGKNRDGKSVYMAQWYGLNGLEDRETYVAGDIVPKRLEITCYDGLHYTDTYTFRFKKGQKLENLFFTFAFAVPDISKDAITLMDKEQKKRFAHIGKVAPLSQLQWTNRTKIYNFVLLQSLYEAQMQKRLNVARTRHKHPRVLMAMVEKSKGTLRSTLDLRSVGADVYGDEKQVHSFNLMDGLYSSKAEAASIQQGKDLFSLWMEQQRPLLTILPKKRYKDAVLAMMEQNGFDTKTREHFQESEKVMIVPKNFSPKDGWLEIDPQSYRLVSVLPNGMYGAMTETILTQENIETTTRYFLGLLIGSNISVGSVINYALLGEEDFKLIKEKSHKLAKVLGCYAKKFETAAGDPMGTAKSAVKDTAGKEGDDITNMIESTFDCKDGGKADDKKPKEYKDFVNFGKGIDQAISNYFDHMK